jgi:hypothetical protein
VPTRLAVVPAGVVDEAKAAPAAIRAAKARQRKTLKNAPHPAAPVPPGRDAAAGVDAAAVSEAARIRRRRCAIPDEEGHRPKWTLVIEMLDELAAQGLRPPLLATDAGYGDTSQFRSALDERGIVYSVQIKGDALAHTADTVPVTRIWSGQGRPPSPATPVYPDDAVSLAEHVTAAGRSTAVTVSWREGSKGTLSSRFVFLRVRPAGHRIPRAPDGSLPERWLIAEWPDTEPQPVTSGCPASPPTPLPPT